VTTQDVERVIGYTRVSTAEQDKAGVSPPAQRKTIRAAAKASGWALVEIVDDVASGKSMQRPGIQRVLERLKAGDADALVVARANRLSRDVGDFSALLKQAEKQGWALILLDLGIDTSTAAGEMMATNWISFAQYERRRIGERTREALAALPPEQRAKVGRPRRLPAKVVRRIRNLRSRGHSLAAIAERLNADDVPTAHGGAKWHPSTVKAVLDRPDR
jgi:DNA invertase Pin-like site-specific DNA recombinase